MYHLCVCVFMRERREAPACVQFSVLLQYEVLELISRAEQEGRRLAITRNQLPNSRDLGRAELGRCPSAPSTLTMTV